ncbi:permease-like cell division protein FtsX [Planomonospora corallina]|uniref:Permease-like cell division protein FtsX n=1 Tax=Planomonospora corallina TaxID=1806052 RepID=A0ABV8I4L8_9ACTN
METEESSSAPPARGSGRGVRRAVVTAAAVAAVLLGVAGAGAWFARAEALRPSQPPVVPWPEGGMFRVYLCEGSGLDREECGGRAATREERRALEARLRELPQVTELAFESREEAFAAFADSLEPDDPRRESISPEDLPESFKGELRRHTDIAGFPAEVEKLPGVSGAVAYGRDFWWGRAHLTVSLCGERDVLCDGRGPATEEEKDAVVAALRSAGGVEEVYFEDAAHARRVMSHIWGPDGESATPVESYRVELADPASERAVVAAVRGLPGVQSVDEVARDALGPFSSVPGP